MDRVEQWKKTIDKAELVETLIQQVGMEYQKLGGQIFSDFILAQGQDSAVKDMRKFLERLSQDNVPSDINRNIIKLTAYAEVLRELTTSWKELIRLIQELQPETHKEAPIPNANS